NVIIFGESGVGKSSLINMLSGDDNASAAVSNQALGCTFETEPYRVTIDEREYVLWDTAGLNEGSKGSVTADEACEKLVHLLQQLRGGVHLLVYVVRGTRLRSIVKINYDIFQRVVFRGQVPIVLVATGLENEDRMENWWDENGGDLAGNGLQFDGHACVTTTKGKRLKSGEHMLEEEYAQSRDLVRALIKE
ncbi:P-loop containing nucleoside triphosphate hydrolase protein, partial [Coniophora puteana RWD-64-598 SS2]